jgi:hypothetical protein
MRSREERYQSPGAKRVLSIEPQCLHLMAAARTSSAQ